MEILIVGIVIVALMAYASTKIKQSAAEAFEREEIETEDFSLVKPAGFINPINEKSNFAFEAYTKDLGTNEARNMRRARATIRVVSGIDFQTICRDTKNSAGRILSKNHAATAFGESKIFMLETEKTESETKIFSFWKIVENKARGKVYELEVAVLEEYLEEYTAAANEMIDSFTVK